MKIARLLLPILLAGLPGLALGQDKVRQEAISEQIAQAAQRCWMPPNSEPVTLWVRLAPDGGVIDLDNVVLYNNAPALAATRAAVSAVLACSPFDMLDPDEHALWNEIRIAFKP